MLRQDKRIIFILIAMFLFSCSKNDKKNEYAIKCSQISIQNIGGDRDYRTVFLIINDTLTNWKIHGLIDFRSGSCDYSSNRVDSLLLFNKQKDKMVTAILEKGCNEDYGDGIHFFYGAKIKGQWYFFAGAYILLPREMYVSKDKVHEPISFAKLHEIAMKEVFNGYLIEKKTKRDLGWWKNTFSPEYKYEYEINEHFFDELNTPLVAFAERKTNPNCPFSCRVIDNEKEYAECLLKKQALSIWNEERVYIKNDPRWRGSATTGGICN
jgi:hypothetical protein